MKCLQSQPLIWRRRDRYHESENTGRIICKGSAGDFWIFHAAALYKWQHGTALPTMDNMVVLAAVFGVKIDDILVVTDTQMRVSA